MTGLVIAALQPARRNSTNYFKSITFIWRRCGFRIAA
jgi:hypothetical protein